MMRARFIRLAVVLSAALVWSACDSTPGARGGSAPTTEVATSAGRAVFPAAVQPGAVSEWPTYHRTLDRAGTQPGMPAVGKLAVAWKARLDGAVYASPVLIGDAVLAATENSSVYLLRNGKVLWRRHIGAPVSRSSLPCGNIDPLGITGTPFYEQATNTVFVAAELAKPIRHELVALNASTGAVRWRRSLDVPGVIPSVQQQRGALTVTAGRVFVPFGGLAGDCGDYHGWVVGVPESGTGAAISYRTPDGMSGIWTPPGPSIAPDGSLLVSVGNGRSGSPPYEFSDSVLRLSPKTLARLNYFAPSSWRADNDADLDLGSNGPQLVRTAQGWRVVIAGKRGVAYLLSPDHLGGVGHELAHLDGCAAYGGSASGSGVVFLPCRDGVRALVVGPSSLRWAWHATPAGSPVLGGGAVWSVDAAAGVLHALSPRTGRTLRTVDVGVTSRFATPALSRAGLVVVPTMSGVTVVSGG